MSRFLKLFIIWLILVATIIFTVNYLSSNDLIQTNGYVVAKATVLSAGQTKNDTSEQVSILGDSSDSSIIGQTQILNVQINSGVDEGKIVTINNDNIQLSTGDHFFAIRSQLKDGIYSVDDPNRLNSLTFFLILFITILFLFGGIQGIRGLISLIGSIGLIIYVLIPAILQRYKYWRISL